MGVQAAGGRDGGIQAVGVAAVAVAVVGVVVVVVVAASGATCGAGAAVRAAALLWGGLSVAAGAGFGRGAASFRGCDAPLRPVVELLLARHRGALCGFVLGGDFLGLLGLLLGLDAPCAEV